LTAEGIRSRVVSMPSWELFEQQDSSYRDQIFPPAVKARVSVEQSATFGWAQYVGSTGKTIGMHTFGSSAPLKDLLKKFGFAPDKIVEAAKESIANSK
jgi:transketolase